MNTSRKHTGWFGAGLLISLLAGSPVWADDVELLLSTPAASNAAKPNILFIIDSSGSMTTVENSQEPYDSDESYGGPCDSGKYYWATNSNIPQCGNQYKFNKNVFYCQQGVAQARAAGSFTDTMAMYRPSNGKWKWRTLNRNSTGYVVDCEDDSGSHGSNSSPLTATYVRRGNNKDEYTTDQSREVSWGDRPTHQKITVYDSNYLNWYYNPPGTSMRRTDIVKAVTKNVLGSVKDVNVGFMRFHHSQGGPVIHAIKDLEENRAEANAVVDGIPASGWTPLSETLYEAALYWRGMPGDYGGTSSTDDDALLSSDPFIYDQPADYACAKNFVVLLTDGEPTEDKGAYYKVPTLPEYNSVMGRGDCTGANENGACLDDIAEYLSKADINPNVPGTQSVTTYTIGFSVDLPILKKTAELSGGEYYLASDVKTLTTALTDIVTNIFDRDISFTAPAVAVNAFNRTQHLNDLYVPVFRATDEMHWPGNVKKYTIRDSEVQDSNNVNAIDPDTGFFADSAKNFWSTESKPDGSDVFRGGVANVLPDPSVRNLYTNNNLGDLTDAGNSLSSANIAAFQGSDFGLTGASGEPELEQLIDWARGVDVKNSDGIDSTKTRNSMGDTLHSQPATVIYGGDEDNLDIVLFTATNDGYLHAINATSGKEMWSFIPRELLANLGDLYINENIDFKNYGLDGDVIPIVYDENGDGEIQQDTDFVYLTFGMRRGGDKYYLLDVTNQDRPILKWIKTYPEFGQTWSAPVVAKVKVNSDDASSDQDAVLIFGAGYDTTHDSAAHPDSNDVQGAGIFMLDVETGEQIWRAGRDSFADLTLERMTRSIPTKTTVIDIDGDGYADRMYSSDLGGQIWRFDITSGATPANLVTGGVIAQLGAEGLQSPTAADTRRFYTAPDVAMFTDHVQQRRYLAINIGSGYRAHPLDNSAADSLYSLRDPDIIKQLTQSEYDNYSIIRYDDLVDVAGKLDTVIPKSSNGWRFTLPPREKVLSDARTFDDSVYFVTFEPQVNSLDPCQAGLSVNRVYRLDVSNGDPTFREEISDESEPEEIDEARILTLEQGGIAPVAVFLFPSSWDRDCKGSECVPRPLACVGVECFDPDFTNRPVRTLWTQDGVE